MLIKDDKVYIKLNKLTKKIIILVEIFLGGIFLKKKMQPFAAPLTIRSKVPKLNYKMALSITIAKMCFELSRVLNGGLIRKIKRCAIWRFSRELKFRRSHFRQKFKNAIFIAKKNAPIFSAIIGLKANRNYFAKTFVA